MQVAVIKRAEANSVRIYRDNILREFKDLNVKVRLFSESGPIPGHCDLVWEPGLCSMRRIPKILSTSYAPVIGTMHGHGLAAFTQPLKDVAATAGSRARLELTREALLYDWRWYSKRTSCTVAVSHYGAKEIIASFGLRKKTVRVIHLGVDHSVFNAQAGWQRYGQPYFLHVSSCDPNKNIENIFAAYSKLAQHDRPDLVAVIPRCKERFNIKGLRLIRSTLSQSELARWYCGAIGNVVPSGLETFAMPITEAMACGCPVITSNTTACAEIAGAAALLVNPRSVDEIAGAMHNLAADAGLWRSLRQKGLARARQFTWRQSAGKLLQVFRQAILQGRENGT